MNSHIALKRRKWQELREKGSMWGGRNRPGARKSRGRGKKGQVAEGKERAKEGGYGDVPVRINIPMETCNINYSTNS